MVKKERKAGEVGSACLVLALEADNVGQVAHVALHAVDALDDDDDLLTSRQSVFTPVTE
jgi:hypothetical protein